MNVEERVRSALHEEAERFEPSPQLWRRVQEGTRFRRGRVRQLALVAVAAAAALVVANVSVLRGDGERLRVTDGGPPAPATHPSAPEGDHGRPPTQTTPGPGVEGTASPAPSTSSTAPAPLRPGDATAAPGTLVAATKDSRVVVMSSADGSVRRVLYEPSGCSRCTVGAVFLSPDGRTVYFHLLSEERDRVLKVPVEGGPATMAADGCSASLSPDGQKLAYVGGQSHCTGPLVVRDLTSGRERHFARDSDRWEVDHFIGSSAWQGDSRTLVLEASQPEAPSELWSLDTGSASTLADARRLGPPDRLDNGTSWFDPKLRGYDGLIAVVQDCCALDADSYDGGSKLVVVEPTTGAVRGEYETAFHLEGIAYDGSGRHLLLVDAAGTIYRRSGGEAPVRIATGFTSVDW